MGYFQAAFFTGFGFGPLMGGVLTEHFGMDVAFITMGALNFLAFLGVALFLPETVKRKMALGVHSSYREASGGSGVRGIFSFRLAFSFSRGAFATFLPVYAGLYVGLSPSLIGILVTVNILLMALLQISGGHLADRFSRRALVLIGSVTNIVFMLLIPASGNFWQLLVVCALGGLGGAVSMPAASALTVEEGRQYGMGVVMAIFAVAFSIGMAVGPILAGIIADVFGINAAFYFGAAMGLAGTSLFAYFTGRVKK
jgi:MFS family permease